MRLPYRPEHEQPAGAVRQADVVAEGWVTRRGRSTVFCRAVYAVREPR